MTLQKCKICGNPDLCVGELCRKHYNVLQLKRYHSKKLETDWQYFCRKYKNPRFRLAKYKALLIQQELHKGKW